MKRCRKCGELKSLDEFYVHLQMADGHLNNCITCVKTRVAKHRSRNTERIRAYDRDRAAKPERVAMRKRVAERWKADPKLKGRRNRHSKEWQERNESKRSAHVLVGNALREGKLLRQPCDRCGSPIAEAHHDDYSKPLEVQWLCKPHHAQRHRELRAAGRGEL